MVPDYSTARKEHGEQIGWLVDFGVDFILIETMNSFSEAKAATEAAIETGLPACTSVGWNDDRKLLSGEDLVEVSKKPSDLGIAAFFINCTPPAVITKSVDRLSKHLSIPLGAYGNIGMPEDTVGWEFTNDCSIDEYTSHAMDWKNLGVKIIGGCCGTTPEHIKHLCDNLNDKIQC